MATSSQVTGSAKLTVPAAKPGVNKVGVKEAAMSPGQAVADEERTELLGSLTTQQQQRTSARVIKKLRLEPQIDKRDATECETPTKIDDKELKFPTVKQRMPKALWSADEKSLFFEALNEYGKDFDAITAYICAKMKKKGMPDANLKTKMQVSHFYYRTWHKLSKHVDFDENVKKVAQELYALINYGELRRKLASVNEKTCARLGELVRMGSMAVRARGRTVKVRTPMCRALKRLNQIAERAGGARVCSRAQVSLRARTAGAWGRVQAAAHNPRAAAALPLRTRLAALLRALEKRWKTSNYKNYKLEEGIRAKPIEELTKEVFEYQEIAPGCDNHEDLESHLHLPTDRIIVQEYRLPKKPALHLGPRPDIQIHLPVLSPSEQLSSQKICFSSYLERMGSQRRDKDSGVKIRTPKRQRKDSVTDKDKELEKKIKIEDLDSTKLMNIDETAIDGIELMAHYKNNQEDEEKPSTEDEKDVKSEETVEEEMDRDKDMHDKYMSEKEKDSFSEMEDDEKYTKSDTDNESDGKGDKSQKERKFKNLKVKFRIVRPPQRGASVFKVILEKDSEESKTVEVKVDDSKIEESQEEAKPYDSKCEEKEEEIKPDFDMDLAIRQIRKGWSAYDAGDLTIGDLYLMFGNRSKLELDYWWAIPTPPLPQPVRAVKQETLDKDKNIDKREKCNKTPDKGDSSVEDEREKRESDMDIFSPKNTFSQDSNDGMSGDERKSEQLLSPDHKSSGTMKLVNKLINKPTLEPVPDGFSLVSDRLKRLLALAGNTHVSANAAPVVARCECGHVCPLSQKNKQKQQPNSTQGAANMAKISESASSIFKHPTPIAPKGDPETHRAMCLDGLPKWRRGRPRKSDRRVVVQRLLPLLPKLPPPSNLIPVKLAPNPPTVLPRLLPKPPPATASEFYYVLSQSNGQFFYHDGDQRIPINQMPLPDNGNHEPDADIKTDEEEDTKDIKIVKVESLASSTEQKQDDKSQCSTKSEQTDITSFLPSESMSLSPSRLLRDAEGWLEGSVQDFSLSSFLGHLEGRPRPESSVDSQLQSLMAESSVDYVAKFADLAAEVTDESDLADELT
ncbi:protein cramped [Pararge aegeria]|nr:protein cramped [Pararge aegeria]